MKQEKSARLKPSQKSKKRYISFSIKSEKPVKGKELLLSLRNTLNNFWLIEFNERTQSGIIRCRREQVQEVRKKLNSLNEIAGQKVSLKTLKTSGSLKKLRERV